MIFSGTAMAKRGAMVNGVRGAASIHVTDMVISALDPVTPEIAARVSTKAPTELLQVYVEGSPDLREGDMLVVNDRDYPIRSCAEWDWRGSRFLHLVVEDIKAPQ